MQLNDIPSDYRSKILEYLRRRSAWSVFRYDEKECVFKKRTFFVDKVVPEGEVVEIYQLILQEEQKRSGGDGCWGGYFIGAFVAGILIFFAIWIYSLSKWGLLFGLLFGWLPAVIGAFVGGFLWPLLFLLLLILLLYFLIMFRG